MRHVCDYCYCDQGVWDVTTGVFLRLNGCAPEALCFSLI